MGLRGKVGTTSPLWQGKRGWLLGFIAMTWFFMIGVRLVVPALLPFIADDFGLGLTAAGLLVTILYGVYALGQFPGGLLGDRIGERNTLVLSTALSAAAVGLLTVPLGLPAFVLGLILFGLGSAMYSPTRLTVLSDVFPERDGTAIGFTLAAGNAGNTVLPALAGLVAATYAWQFGFGLTLPFFVLAVVGLWWAVPRVTSQRMEFDAASWEFVRRVASTLTRRSVFTIAMVLLLNNFIWQALTGIYPTYLVTAKGLTESTAALLFGLFFGWGIAVQLASGTLGDRFGAKRSLVAVFVVAILSLVLLPLVDGLVALFLVTLGLSSILGFSPIVFPYLNAELPDDIQGSGLGLIRSIYMTIAAVGPVLMGALGEAGWFDEAFFILVAVAVVSLGFALLMPPRER